MSMKFECVEGSVNLPCLTPTTLQVTPLLHHLPSLTSLSHGPILIQSQTRQRDGPQPQMCWCQDDHQQPSHGLYIFTKNILIWLESGTSHLLLNHVITCTTPRDRSTKGEFPTPAPYVILVTIAVFLNFLFQLAPFFS